MWLTGPVAPRHVGSSQTRARTRVPCIGRQILNHYATREAPPFVFLSSFSVDTFSLNLLDYVNILWGSLFQLSPWDGPEALPSVLTQPLYSKLWFMGISKSPKGSYSFRVNSLLSFPASASFGYVFHYLFLAKIGNDFQRRFDIFCPGFLDFLQWDIFSGHFTHNIGRNRNLQNAKQIEHGDFYVDKID